MDETMAGTDGQHQSTLLPSILPAMNSIHSNDIITSLNGGRSIQMHHMVSPDSGVDTLLQNSIAQQQRNNKSSVNNAHHQTSLNIENLNNRSVNLVGKSQASQPMI